MIMTRKQLKTSRHQPSKPVSTINFFEGFDEELDNTNINVRMEKTVKSPPIFVARVHNFSNFSQLLKSPLANTK